MAVGCTTFTRRGQSKASWRRIERVTYGGGGWIRRMPRSSYRFRDSRSRADLAAVPPGTVLFVLAHQDDEIAFHPVITRLAAEARPVEVVYLTDGSARGALPERRNAESRAVLERFGVSPTDVWFLVTEARIEDRGLHTRLDDAYGLLRNRYSDRSRLSAVYTLAYEGGHPDHDAANAVAALLAQSMGRLDSAFQVPVYRAADGGRPWFVLFAPLAENGPVTAARIGAAESSARVSLMFRYPSQWRSFLGLGPALIRHALARTPFQRQPLRLDRLGSRPMQGPLLYERFWGIDFVEIGEAIRRFAGKVREAG